MQIDGKNILITGASSGIGRALAQEFAARGTRLAIASRTLAKLETVAQEVVKSGGVKPLVFQADLSQPGEATRLGQRVLEQLGHIDILVNCAGINVYASQIVGGDSPIPREMFELNYWSPLALTKAIAPQMAGGGTIVNISSVAALTPMALCGHYAASKAALLAATETLRMELRGSGISVLLVLPGPVRTPGLKDVDRLPGGKAAFKGAPVVEAKALASKIVQAIVHDKETLVYPRLMQFNRLFPALAMKFARHMSRAIDVTSSIIYKGGA